jgi:membrane dipeptidase
MMSKKLNGDAYKFPIADAHCDTLTLLLNSRKTISDDIPSGHITLSQLRESGVKLQFMSAFVDSQHQTSGALARGMQLIDQFWRMIQSISDGIFVQNFLDIKKCLGSDKIGFMLTVEGGEVLEGQIAALRMLNKLGVRSIGLTWNKRNDIAEGVAEFEANGGLTRFGREVVFEMNRLGMLIDVAHMARKSFYDVLSVSAQPIIVSHANCYTLCKHPRNLTDEQMKALAEKDGLLGITFCPEFLSDKKNGIDDIIRHIDHACKIMGVKHVGLGSDFDGIETTPAGMSNASCWPLLSYALLKKGYLPTDVRRIMAYNIISLLRKVLKEI